jgi:hypothetical protein
MDEAGNFILFRRQIRRLIQGGGMNRLISFAAVVIATAGVAAVLTSTPKSANAAVAAAVQVVNTPLPITGNVNAAVTGDVNATVVGPVSLAPGTSVTIGNSAADPVMVQDVGGVKTPWHSFGGAFCNGAGCLADLGTVPSNYRLVVEHISGAIHTGIGEQLTATVVGHAYLTCCISSNDDYLAPEGPNEQGFFNVNHQTLMFFNAGDTVRLLVNKTGSAPGTVNFSVSGYLLPQ